LLSDTECSQINWGPIYKISYDLSYDYRKFVVRSTYNSDLKRAEISLRNIVTSLRTPSPTILHVNITKAVTRIYFRGCWGHRRRKGSGWGGHHGECGTRAYNGGLGAEPTARSRGTASGQGVRGASTPEAESILVIGYPTEPANLAPLVKFSR